MALTQCVDCGHDVSTLSAACPNCGRPTDSHQPELPDDKERIACPDSRCPGTLGKEGTCGACGKAANWKDDEEETCAGTPDKPHQYNYGNIIVLGLTFVFLLFGILISGKSHPPPTPSVPETRVRTEEDIKRTAVFNCKAVAMSRLKSPASAKFPLGIAAEHLGGGIYRVKSSVDSQNSFGAMLRSNFTCDLQYVGGDDTDAGNWRLIDIQME